MTRLRGNELSCLTGVILAGGLGTRLRSILPEEQKVMAGIHGRPFICYLLDQLSLAGLQRVVLCVSYRAEQVVNQLGDSYRSLALSYSTEHTPRGTAGAIQQAMPLIESDSILVMNGDSFCDVDLGDAYESHISRQSALTIVAAHLENTDRFGLLRLDSDDHLLAFEEKQTSAGPGWINAGIYIMGRHMLRDIPVDSPSSLERDIFPKWLGLSCFAYRTHGKFIDIGTPQSFRDASTILAHSDA